MYALCETGDTAQSALSKQKLSQNNPVDPVVYVSASTPSVDSQAHESSPADSVPEVVEEEEEEEEDTPVVTDDNHADSGGSTNPAPRCSANRAARQRRRQRQQAAHVAAGAPQGGYVPPLGKARPLIIWFVYLRCTIVCLI